MNKKESLTDRRGFLLSTLKMSGQLALANTAIYTVSLSFGSLTAGAKCAPEMSTQVTSIPDGPPKRMYQRYRCIGGVWTMEGSSWCQIGGTPTACN